MAGENNDIFNVGLSEEIATLSQAIPESTDF
jgi:hypothetical protein